MQLTKMRFGGVPPFTEPVEITFDPTVNVLVGPNATGKSRLLSAMDEFFNERNTGDFWPKTREQIDLQFSLGENMDFSDDWAKDKNLLCADRTFNEAYYGMRGGPRPPVIYIGPTRIGLPHVSDLGESDQFGSTVEEILSGEFSGARLNAAIEMVSEKTRDMFDEEKEQDLPTGERRAWNFLYVDRVSHSCAKSICEELITSERGLNYPTGLDVDYIADQPLADLEGISINRLLGIATTDTPRFDHLRPEDRPINLGGENTPRIYLGDLSSGSQSTLLWIFWLALKMLNYYEFTEGWAHRPAVLLIDEVENHLHPTWQRRVIPSLLKYFPGLQIFATTHSPFVVAGLKKGQVHMLKRDSEGMVMATTNERDIIGWTTDEILRTFMEVDEPTDQMTVNRAIRLRELRGLETRSESEEEELSELRRQVNEDFISSSTPMEAQRERYGDMMLEFLRLRQSELSQDGS